MLSSSCNAVLHPRATSHQLMPSTDDEGWDSFGVYLVRKSPNIRWSQPMEPRCQKRIWQSWERWCFWAKASMKPIREKRSQKSMSSMLHGARSFNQTIGDWYTSHVRWPRVLESDCLAMQERQIGPLGVAASHIERSMSYRMGIQGGLVGQPWTVHRNSNQLHSICKKNSWERIKLWRIGSTDTIRAQSRTKRSTRGVPSSNG